MECMWTSEMHVAIAVSGGVDSMVLLDLVRQTPYASLTILHVNHGLRQQSIEEEAMIRAYATRFNIACIVKTVPPNYFNPNKSIQHTARAFRYRFFDEAMKDKDILLTAHHASDVEETVLFKLLTGRFRQRDIGIAPISERGRYKLARPLLYMTKDNIYELAARLEVPFMEDASNLDDHYVRNKIRHHVIPAINDVSQLNTQHLRTFNEWHSEVTDLIDEQVQNFMNEANVTTSKIIMDRAKFIKLRAIVKRAVVVYLLNEHHLYNISLKAIDELIEVMCSNEQHVQYIDKYQIELTHQHIIFKVIEEINQELEIVCPGKYEFNGYMIEIFKLYSPIIIRTRQDGDRIAISGYHQKVSRILKDHKIALTEREKLPLVLVQNEIIKVSTIKQNEHPMNEHISIIKKEFL